MLFVLPNFIIEISVRLFQKIINTLVIHDCVKSNTSFVGPVRREGGSLSDEFAGRDKSW